MAYSTNPYLPKARAFAMQLLIREQFPVQTVANRCGVHRSTVWRWKRKWDVLNQDVQMDNPNRPRRVYSRENHLSRCAWRIPTDSARPRTSPTAVSEDLARLVLAVRAQLKRCAEVVWHHLVTVLAVSVSLSSVRRILRRHHCFDDARKPRVRPDNPRRPLPARPGELVQTDTIHYICPLTSKRRYVYTVIDLYSRMSYAHIATSILPGLAARTILSAQKHWGFKVLMVQADNGPEFGRYFEQTLKQDGIQVRHSRLGRPNDNAHIERFNRTIQEECIGSRISSKVATATLQLKIDRYIDYYNHERIHLGIQYRTPAEMLQRF